MLVKVLLHMPNIAMTCKTAELSVGGELEIRTRKGVLHINEESCST